MAFPDDGEAVLEAQIAEAEERLRLLLSEARGKNPEQEDSI